MRAVLKDSWDPRILVAAGAALIISAICLLTQRELEGRAQRNLAQAQQQATSLAHLLEEHATRTLDAASQSTRFLRQRYLEQGRALDINGQLQQGLGIGPIYNLFTILDERGDVVLSSRPFKATNLADREHFRVHARGGADELYISKPVVGRVSGRASLQLTRRISAADGSWRGVVVVSLDPGYLQQLYRMSGVGELGTIALVGADGIVRVQSRDSVHPAGSDVGAGPLFQAMQGRSHGQLLDASGRDGRERIYAFAKLADYPLYAAVGIDRAERLAPLARERRQAWGLAALACVLLAAGAALLIVLIGRVMRSRARAVAAGQAQARLLANMAHELRTPLNGILGFSSLLCESLEQGEAREFAGQIQACGERQLLLVDAFLELAALDAGQQVQLAPADVRILARQALQAVAEGARARGIALDSEIGPEVPQEFRCDAARLAKVLDKLLANALAHTSQGRICLTVRRVGGGIEFSVSDTGSGIPPALHEKIFQPFVQADDSPTRRIGGAGLGLALADAWVRSMGGRIGLQSAPGRGARFHFTLPRQIPETN